MKLKGAGKLKRLGNQIRVSWGQSGKSVAPSWLISPSISIGGGVEGDVEGLETKLEGLGNQAGGSWGQVRRSWESTWLNITFNITRCCVVVKVTLKGSGLN